MQRTLIWLAAWAVIVLAGGELIAQDAAWPAFSTGLTDPHAIARGPGFYAAPWKLILLAVVAWAWVKSADWVGRDSDEIGNSIGLPGTVWKPILVFAPLAGFLLALTIPIFFAGLPIFLLAYAVPFAIYVVQRNSRVGPDKRVLTAAHLSQVFSSLGKKDAKQREVKHAWQSGPAVDLVALGPLQMENQQALIEARQNDAYVPVKRLLADALAQRADRILIEYAQDAVALKYQVDGVWVNANPKVHDKQPLDRPLGDSMLLVLKRVAHLKGQERRAKQEGKLRVEFEGNKYDTTLTTQGTQGGERVVVLFKLITKTVRSLDDLGMRDKLREQLAGIMGPGQHGVVVFAALPGDGLTNTWSAALRGTDRLMRDFVSIEDVSKREPEVENVDVQKFDATKKELPSGIIPKLIVKQPEVICVPEIADTDAVGMLFKWIQDENKLCLLSLRAKDGADAIQRLLALKAPPDSVSATLRGVVYTRLIRKLCETCRQAMQPSPELLQKLGIPAGRVQVLYQEKQPLQPGEQRKRGVPEICPDCKGLGYKGRTAIFEILVVDDKIRQAILKGANADAIKKLSRAAGNRSLQEEGVLLVALGTTSIAELQRVLKQ